MKIISICVKKRIWAFGGVLTFLLTLLNWEVFSMKWPWDRWFCLPGLSSSSSPSDDFVRRQASWGWSDFSYFPSLLELSDACIWNVHFNYVKLLPFSRAKSCLLTTKRNESGLCKKTNCSKARNKLPQKRDCIKRKRLYILKKLWQLHTRKFFSFSF